MTYRELYAWPSVGLRVWHNGEVLTVEAVGSDNGTPLVEFAGVPVTHDWRWLLSAGAVPLPRPGEWWSGFGDPLRVTDVAPTVVAMQTAGGMKAATAIDSWPSHRAQLAVRIQRHRLKGWRLPPGAVSVCRPGRWGNPWRVGDPGVPDAAMAVRLYRAALAGGDCDSEWAAAMEWQRAHLGDLRGRVLACACGLDQPCHADKLIELANQPESRANG